MSSSRLLPALLFLLVVSARPLCAQVQQTQPSPQTPTKSQAPLDYTKFRYQIPLVNEKSEMVVGLAFSPDSKVIAVLYPGSIGFWATSTGAPIGFAAGTLEKFTALAFAPSGLLVTGGEDGGVAMWDWHDLAKPKMRTGGFDPITAIAVSLDNALIVTAHRGETPTLTLWEAGTGKKIRTLSGLAVAEAINYRAFDRKLFG